MIAKVTDRTPEVTHFAAGAQWTGILSSDRDAWLTERHKYLTASDMAAVLGEDRYRSAFSVYIDKITARPAKEVIDINDPRFWGSALEQTILTRTAAFFGWQYREGGALLASRRYPFLGATLDGEVDCGNGWENCEGKTTSYLCRRDWDEETQDIPRRVLIQVQSQLLVTQAERAKVICLINGNRLVRVTVEPSEAFHALLVEEGERFMDMVARRIEPPCGANDTDLLLRLYPEHTGAVVRLPAVATEWARELDALGAQRRAIERREKEIKNWLRRSIASASWGMLSEPVADRQFFKLSTESVPTHTVEAHDKHVIRAIKHGPRIVEPLPFALNDRGDPDFPVEGLEESVALGSRIREHVETTKTPKKRRKARR